MADRDKGFQGTEASQYLKDKFGLKHGPAYLAWLRSRGGGPKFYLVGRTPHYSPHDLDDYGRSKTGPVVSTTAEHRASLEAA